MFFEETTPLNAIALCEIGVGSELLSEVLTGNEENRDEGRYEQRQARTQDEHRGQSKACGQQGSENGRNEIRAKVRDLLSGFPQGIHDRS